MRNSLNSASGSDECIDLRHSSCFITPLTFSIRLRAGLSSRYLIFAMLLVDRYSVTFLLHVVRNFLAGKQLASIHHDIVLPIVRLTALISQCLCPCRFLHWFVREICVHVLKAHPNRYIYVNRFESRRHIRKKKTWASISPNTCALVQWTQSERWLIVKDESVPLSYTVFIICTCPI